LEIADPLCADLAARDVRLENTENKLRSWREEAAGESFEIEHEEWRVGDHTLRRLGGAEGMTRWGAKKTEKNSNDGPWPVYPSRKLWDEVRVRTGPGKEFHHSVISEFAAEDGSELHP